MTVDALDEAVKVPELVNPGVEVNPTVLATDKVPEAVRETVLSKLAEPVVTKVPEPERPILCAVVILLAELLSVPEPESDTDCVGVVAPEAVKVPEAV